MRTYYEHPPRTIQFYLKYIAILFVIVLPLLLLIPIIATVLDIPLLFYLPAMSMFVGWGIQRTYRPFMEMMVSTEDLHIDKEQDVSAFDFAPPVQLDEIILQLEMDGFERLAETEAWYGLHPEPISIWKLSADNGEIIAEAVMNPRGKPYVALGTHCEGGTVATFYGTPVVKLEHENQYFVSISTNLSDALAYHRLKVAEMRPIMGAVIPVSSLTQLSQLSGRYLHVQQQKLTATLYQSTILQAFFNMSIIFIPLLIAAFFTMDSRTILGALIVSIPLLIIGYAMVKVLQQAFKPLDPTSILEAHRQSLGGFS